MSPDSEHDKHSHHSWHFNAIYSAVAGVIGLMCVLAIVVITVYRIHMRREAVRHMLGRSRNGSGLCRRVRHPAGNRMTSSGMSASWQRNLPLFHDSTCETYRQMYPPNVAINLNLQLGGMAEINNLMMTPPPYSEVQEPPASDPPPPPYSTIDRRSHPPNYSATSDNLSPNEQNAAGDTDARVSSSLGANEAEFAADTDEAQGLLSASLRPGPDGATQAAGRRAGVVGAAEGDAPLLPQPPAAQGRGDAPLLQRLPAGDATTAADCSDDGTICLNFGAT